MKSFFSPEEEQKIIEAIEKAERKTSGEIKLHIESRCWFSAVFRAKRVFKSLEMNRTAEKNGVLIYIAINSKKFAIIGDTGINEKVGQKFWESTKELMQAEFKKGNFFAGSLAGIESAGEQLQHFFPYLKHDTNELSNDISYGH
jgi:uncharacterized membrane protein